MKAFSDCFAIPQKHKSQASSELSQWAIVLNPPISSATGCRVQQVVGPFWAQAGLASLDHDGETWAVVYRSGEMAGNTSGQVAGDVSGEVNA